MVQFVHGITMTSRTTNIDELFIQTNLQKKKFVLHTINKIFVGGTTLHWVYD